MKEKVDDDGFIIRQRRRPKRFCVLRLSEKVNLDLLMSDINSKGPKVSSVRVFPIRRNPSKVRIKLNIHADSNADMVLNKGFWPHYVSCIPWESQPVNLNQRRETQDIPPRLRDLNGRQRLRPGFETNRQFATDNSGLDHSNRYKILANDI